MKSSVAQLNLLLAWLGILLGFVSGMVLGGFFQREDWLGGYGSLRRRMYRLGHISCFGLGALNLLFWLTVNQLSVTDARVVWVSWAFVVGAVTMPLACLIMAHWPKARLIFAVPVLSLLLGGALMLVMLGRSAAADSLAGEETRPPRTTSREEPMPAVDGVSPRPFAEVIPTARP